MSYFHHVSLLTSQRQENVTFYTQILGLRFVKNTVNQENTRMLHYYYGNYQGSPGSVITFFIVPHLGQRRDEAQFLSEIGLNIPMHSLTYWQRRFESFGVPVKKEANQLIVQDPDQVTLYFTETEAVLPNANSVKNDIPVEKQILGLASINFHVENPNETTVFFEQLLGWTGDNHHIQLSPTESIQLTASHLSNKTRMGRGSIDHVAFAVKDEEALNRLYEKAQQQNWQIEKMISRGYFKSLYLKEPGGNRVEFATVQPGFTLDESLEHLGEQLALPPFLASQRASIEKNLYSEK
ncbi:VOC family protein [Enterococcus dongliensis]|uniref:VOC family protein n=1 Tax=Enterococcus dongliensis TaxID=2559925 RepID=A0AAP5KQL7_9ENTE|nr:VOC family protein [Enterococcus dongliensis]MDT2596193.1 VOC family protein [Enterococcus dongliensis]MDT2603914.1 VOC family protein [Enterococcus dongliensis]MDT2634190.1 VOC family protein [Enterococcus dongliensis]MDT2637120.1 VOC family protein [Enterococcus dongliensis]MDT2639987.1 VOC family protein [Enterococcus dongliensis]